MKFLKSLFIGLLFFGFINCISTLDATISAQAQKRFDDLKSFFDPLKSGIASLSSDISASELSTKISNLPLLSPSKSVQGGKVPSVELSTLAVTAGVINDNKENMDPIIAQFLTLFNTQVDGKPLVNVKMISQSALISVTDSNKAQIVSALQLLK